MYLKIGVVSYPVHLSDSLNKEICDIIDEISTIGILFNKIYNTARQLVIGRSNLYVRLM